ncbi:hypothetical protein BaRGS_00038994 [Batillaria attramentaria]|uniref:Uncharacterized protein n=1 Tax=Batillaria attramentaria TaxID=370345 RepID=A0ABD0J493_9CAEN
MQEQEIMVGGGGREGAAEMATHFPRGEQSEIPQHEKLVALHAVVGLPIVGTHEFLGRAARVTCQLRAEEIQHVITILLT